LKLEELTAGQRVAGLLPADSAAVLAVQRHGAEAVELTYKSSSGVLGQRVLYRSDEPGLTVVLSGGRPFDAPASDFKLVAEAQRIKLADSEWDLVVVDEAHRMGAHYYGGELKKTRRFELGELLGRCARHLLLMTATPHSGKEDDFQLFLTLLDRDQFAGKFREGIHNADTSGLMRRMVKEDLLTFEVSRSSRSVSPRRCRTC
jgi:hypothetical protein